MIGGGTAHLVRLLVKETRRMYFATIQGEKY